MNKKILTLLACTGLLLSPSPSQAQEVQQKLQNELAEVFELTLNNNPEIQSALASIRSARGAAIQAGVRPNPEASIELENFGGQDSLSGVDGAEATFGLTQEIEIAGKRHYRKDVAGYGLEMAKQDAVSTVMAVLATAHQSYADYLIALKRFELAEKRLKLADKTHEAVKKRVKAAAASDIQHTKVDIEQKAAGIEKTKAKEHLATARARLENVLATDIDQINHQADIFSVAFDIPERDALMQAVSSLPQSEILKLRELQAESNVQLAKAYAVPNPTIGLGVRRFNDTDSNAFLATLSIPIPVFDRNQGNLAQAQAERLKAESDARAGMLSLQETSVKIYEQTQAALSEVSAYEQDIIPSSQKAYEQASEGYNSGRFSFLELLDAQRTLYEMQEAHLDSLSKLHQAKAQIDFLMGTNSTFIKNKISTNEGDTE